MGRNKIDIQYIKDDRIRNITFNKRKNGLLKKACELAVLCNVKMLLCFTDLNGRVYYFTSQQGIDMELVQSRHKKSFTKVDYPHFQRKKGSVSQSVSSEDSEEIKKKPKIEQQTQPQVSARNKIIDFMEKQPVTRRSHKIEEQMIKQQEEPPKQEEKRRAQVRKKNEEIVVNDMYVQPPQQNFEDLYQFAPYNNEQISESPDQQDYRSNKLMKIDSLINVNKALPLNDSQQFNMTSFYSKERYMLSSQNNSKVMNQVQFIIPPQTYVGMNPSPIVQPLNKVFVGEDDPMDPMPQQFQKIYQMNKIKVNKCRFCKGTERPLQGSVFGIPLTKNLALIIQASLYQKHSSSQNYYYSRSVQNICQQQKSAEFARYQDNLIYDSSEEHLKAYHSRNESQATLPALITYYKFSIDHPEYHFPELKKILQKYVIYRNEFEYRWAVNQIKAEQSQQQGALKQQILNNKAQLEPQCKNSQYSKFLADLDASSRSATLIKLLSNVRSDRRIERDLQREYTQSLVEQDKVKTNKFKQHVSSHIAQNNFANPSLKPYQKSTQQPSRVPQQSALVSHNTFRVAATTKKKPTQSCFDLTTRIKTLPNMQPLRLNQVPRLILVQGGAQTERKMKIIVPTAFASSAKHVSVHSSARPNFKYKSPQQLTTRQKK